MVRLGARTFQWIIQLPCVHLFQSFYRNYVDTTKNNPHIYFKMHFIKENIPVLARIRIFQFVVDQKEIFS